MADRAWLETAVPPVFGKESLFSEGKNQCPNAGVGFFVERDWSFGFGRGKSDLGQSGGSFMAKPRIFVRDDGQGKYRYVVLAVQGEDIHFYKDRFSRAELELLAREMDAELVFINVEEDIEIDEEAQAPESEESEDVE